MLQCPLPHYKPALNRTLLHCLRYPPSLSPSPSFLHACTLLITEVNQAKALMYISPSLSYPHFFSFFSLLNGCAAKSIIPSPLGSVGLVASPCNQVIIPWFVPAIMSVAALVAKKRRPPMAAAISRAICDVPNRREKMLNFQWQSQEPLRLSTFSFSLFFQFFGVVF